MMSRIITRNIARGLVASPFQKGEGGGEGSFIVSQRGEPQPLTLILSPPAGERRKACAAKLNTLAIIEVSFCKGS
jgi:hypothetical protein